MVGLSRVSCFCDLFLISNSSQLMVVWVWSIKKKSPRSDVEVTLLIISRLAEMGKKIAGKGTGPGSKVSPF